MYRVFVCVLLVEGLLIGLPGYLFFSSAFASLTLAAAPVLLVAFIPVVLEKAARELAPREPPHWRMPVSWYGHVELVVTAIVALLFVGVTFGFVLVGLVNCVRAYPSGGFGNSTLASICATVPLPIDTTAFRAFQQRSLCTGDQALAIVFLILLGITALTLVALLIYQSTRSATPRAIRR